MIVADAHNWSIRAINRRLVRRYAPECHGALLDVGCGDKPYESLLRDHVDSYVGLEHPSTPHNRLGVDCWGDADDLPFEDESFDTVVSFHVLEHTERPQAVLREAHRVLRPGGTLLFTTPFVWGLHEAPRDFFRFTAYGLMELTTSAGFVVDRVEPFCGTWTTLGLRASYALSRHGRGVVGALLMPLVSLIQLAGLLAARIDRSTIDAAGYVTLANRP